MKKILFEITILVILIFIISFILEFFFTKEIYYYKNNRFLFSKSLSKVNINKFKKNYADLVNEFFNINNFYKIKIEEEKLDIIICRNNFDEFSKKNLFFNLYLNSTGRNRKFISRMINISKLNKGSFTYCYGLETILIRKNPYVSIILATHNHLIYKNLSNDLKVLFNLRSGLIPNYHINFQDKIIDYYKGLFIVESIESFFEYILTENKADNLLIDEDKIERFINYNENKKIYYDSPSSFYIDLITGNFDKNSELYINLKTNFVSWIIKIFGKDKFLNLIHTLYNERIDNFDTISQINFGISLEILLTKWKESLK